jgi:hypothetical protein
MNLDGLESQTRMCRDGLKKKILNGTVEPR